MSNAFDLKAKLFTVEVKASKTPMYRTNGLVAPTHRPRALEITGQAQGAKDANRRDAIRRGGL